MGIFRVIFYLNGKRLATYTDAPNAGIAMAIIQVYLQREGYTDFVVKSATKVGAG